MMDNYGGIFNCFIRNKGTVRCLVMAGSWDSDSLYRLTEVIKKDFVDSFIRTGEYDNNRLERDMYYGSRHL